LFDANFENARNHRIAVIREFSLFLVALHLPIHQLILMVLLEHQLAYAFYDCKQRVKVNEEGNK
jgi:hypothetical protein